jgi:hypothetical protein
MVPTASLALCLSSLTQESRYAGFAWFAIWILGWFTYAVMTISFQLAADESTLVAGRWWVHLSLYHTLGQVQMWVFGFEGLREALWSMVVLCALTAVSLLVLFRRVAAPMRV